MDEKTHFKWFPDVYYQIYWKYTEIQLFQIYEYMCAVSSKIVFVCFQFQQQIKNKNLNDRNYFFFLIQNRSRKFEFSNWHLTIFGLWLFEYSKPSCIVSLFLNKTFLVVFPAQSWNVCKHIFSTWFLSLDGSSFVFTLHMGFDNSSHHVCINRSAAIAAMSICEFYLCFCYLWIRLWDVNHEFSAFSYRLVDNVAHRIYIFRWMSPPPKLPNTLS